jgi:hypothetical protein
MNTWPDEPISRPQNYPVARDAANWAKPVERLSLDNVPGNGLSLYVDGWQTLSPLRGSDSCGRRHTRCAWKERQCCLPS